MKRTIAAVVIACGLVSGCAGTHFDWNDARKLKPGMTQAEVTEIMGRPYSVRSAEGQIIWVWSWANGFGSHKAMSVTFADGKLVKVPEIPESF